MRDPPASNMEFACILSFNDSNQLVVRQAGNRWGLPFTAPDTAAAAERLNRAFATHTRLDETFSHKIGADTYRVYLTQVEGPPTDPELSFASIESLEAQPAVLSPALIATLAALEPHLISVPYLHLGENEFIYKFRPEKERNLGIYGKDRESTGLYQSQLCAAIKAHARTHERSATSPVDINFGPVRYVIPSHFGFCLGVKNAIERAYETLAANPGRRVFMLSELIHNPFVNEDLSRRGLRYLQTDKGKPFTISGGTPESCPHEPLLWDTLHSDDIVITPAFGATDEDKLRLIRKGIGIYAYDATCMLVEKVWKAARHYGRDGYTVIIHGKAEHEETKATFSNTRRHAHAVVVRDLGETEQLASFIGKTGPDEQARFEHLYEGKHTAGFDIKRDLQRVAVVNQTTLLVNETRKIIDYLRQTYEERYGMETPSRVGGNGRSDTLCYATQVNQDALGRALASPLDAAFVIGGKNSSNTYQLFRLCEETLGERAYFIQSETNITSPASVSHYVFPSPGEARSAGKMEPRALDLPHDRPARILITGGASCPDGIIQQVINCLNSFYPAENLLPMHAVLADIGVDAATPPEVTGKASD